MKDIDKYEINFDLIMEDKKHFLYGDGKKQYDNHLQGETKQLYFLKDDKGVPYTHILGYPIGGLCRGKKGTRYEGIKAVIELWDDRRYESWAKYRKIPVRYLENKSNRKGMLHDGQEVNGISKVNFDTGWEMGEGPDFPDEPPPEPENNVIEI